jgi:hypothetical protein
MTPLEQFTASYFEALYFTECGPDSEYSPDATLTPEYRRQAESDCRRFFNVYRELIGDNIEQAGHDFWLTRNGHGAGFWDRPEIYGEQAAEELTRASELMGQTWSDFEGGA